VETIWIGMMVEWRGGLVVRPRGKFIIHYSVFVSVFTLGVWAAEARVVTNNSQVAGNVLYA
jgi:hypothetical protein